MWKKRNWIQLMIQEDTTIAKADKWCWGDANRTPMESRQEGGSAFSSPGLQLPQSLPFSGGWEGAAGKEPQLQHHKAEYGKVGLELRDNSLTTAQVTLYICFHPIWGFALLLNYQKAALFLRFWVVTSLSPHVLLSSRSLSGGGGRGIHN